MGLVRTEITLKNGVDMIMAQNGLMGDHEIRQTTVNALVDSGAWTEEVIGAHGDQILHSIK